MAYLACVLPVSLLRVQNLKPHLRTTKIRIHISASSPDN